ncbi:RidA family protein [Halobacterium wangiae]|uniref:RidA family protein n=1 Tax=Halobacterium wangiae TaxID=2902623 RepID=UPI001E5A6461|nr:RidA family protein [Halobacterium wangiae]
MRKILLGPGAGTVDSEELDHAVHSVGVATEHADYTRVSLSGVTSEASGLEAQAREVLDFVGRVLSDVGGTFDDVVTTRWYVEADSLDGAAQGTIHEVRAEFFEAPHYPASTMVGVASVLGERSVLELEVEAEVPDDDWQVDAFVGEDREEMSEDAARDLLTSESGTEPDAEE